jgi:glycosyltransferase involved in cell wall biosynthesis
MRRVVDGEERVITESITPVQQAILATLPFVCEHVRRHGLWADTLKPLAVGLARAVVERPPTCFADAFAVLHHDESFGVGEVDEVGKQNQLATALTATDSSVLHRGVTVAMAQTRWSRGAMCRSATHDWWQAAPIARRIALPTSFFTAQSAALICARGARFSIYAPAPIVSSGGHRTIFNLVRAVSHLGFETHVFLQGVGAGVDVAEAYLGDARAVLHTSWVTNIPSSVAFASLAQSASVVAALEEVHHRGYLVQDYEAGFNPVGDSHVLCENSYGHGLQHFTVGNWLSHLIATRYGAATCPAGLGIDLDVYRRIDDISRESAICFLYQPDKPRRAPRLGIDALRLVRTRFPSVKIYVYGSDLPINLDFPVENLGTIHSLDTLNALYNRCSVGLCLSLSNPSRIPFEMMAAGCVPVDLYRYNNLFDHPDGGASLAYQAPHSLAEAMCQLLADPKATARRAATCQVLAASRSLAWEQDVICNGILELIDRRALDVPVPNAVYTAAAIIAENDRTSATHAFCEWNAHEGGLRRRASHAEDQGQDTSSETVHPLRATTNDKRRQRLPRTARA